MRRRTVMACSLLLCSFAAGVAFAAESPMEAFGALVVGEWQAEDSRQVFEWGVGRKVVRSRSYFKSDGEWALVSEGLWFRDPDAEGIRGIAVAIEMPVELFEYRSKIHGEEIVHDLAARGEAGGHYVERWRFEDGEYRFTLEDPQEGTPIMESVFRRMP